MDFCIIDDIYNHRPARIYKKYSPSLRAERSGLKVICKTISNHGNADITQNHKESNKYE